MKDPKTNVGIEVKYEPDLTFEELKAKNRLLNEQEMSKIEEE